MEGLKQMLRIDTGEPEISPFLFRSFVFHYETSLLSDIAGGRLQLPLEPRKALHYCRPNSLWLGTSAVQLHIVLCLLNHASLWEIQSHLKDFIKSFSYLSPFQMFSCTQKYSHIAKVVNLSRCFTVTLSPEYLCTCKKPLVFCHDLFSQA